jgi:ferredoxin, 2Fe-2S
MAVVSIEVTDRDGRKHVLAGASGQSLMEIIRDAGLPIAAVCQGCLSCATCHVYLDSRPGALPAPTLEELSLLDSTLTLDPQRSRLACQIKLGPDCEGMTATLAPAD